MTRIVLVLIISIPNILLAYEELFRAESVLEIQQTVKEIDREAVLSHRCEIEMNRQGFLWPCFIISREKWSRESMGRHCKERAHKVTSLKTMPAGDELRSLPEVCQTEIRHRMRILDYKANES
jgi:hypothetical protein